MRRIVRIVVDEADAGDGGVYEVDAKTLACLDVLEGHPRYYRRTAILLAEEAPLRPSPDARAGRGSTTRRVGQLARAPEGEGRMKIVMRDGRVFQRTALQIVKAMKDIAFGVEQMTLDQYIGWVVDNARRFEDVESKADGPTTEQRAKVLVEEMVATGLAARCEPVGGLVGGSPSSRPAVGAGCR